MCLWLDSWYIKPVKKVDSLQTGLHTKVTSILSHRYFTQWRVMKTSFFFLAIDTRGLYATYTSYGTWMTVKYRNSCRLLVVLFHFPVTLKSKVRDRDSQPCRGVGKEKEGTRESTHSVGNRLLFVIYLYLLKHKISILRTFDGLWCSHIEF